MPLKSPFLDGPPYPQGHGHRRGNRWRRGQTRVVSAVEAGQGHKIKLVAIDIDGTLLDSARKVPEANRQALARAQAAGITVCLATGRLVPTILPIAEMAGVQGPLVTCNGAYVEAADGTPVLDTCLPDTVRDTLLDFADAEGITANVYQPRRVLSNRESERLALYRARTKAEPVVMTREELSHQRATKIIFIDEPNVNAQNFDRFSPLAGHESFHLTVSEPIYLEFLPPRVNKGVGLQALAAHMGLGREEVAAIGDYYNDREMLAWVGTSAVMASAPPDLHSVAGRVVATNDDCGVAEFLDLILGNL